MKKKNKEELLSILEAAFSHLLKDINYKETKAKYEQAHLQIKEMIHHAGIDEGWLPTPENINALPEPVKKFIYHIETNTDPAHIVRENILIKDTCKALVLKLEERAPMVDQAFVNIWADKYLSKGDVCYLRKQLKLMLNEAGVKVVKN